MTSQAVASGSFGYCPLFSPRRAAGFPPIIIESTDWSLTLLLNAHRLELTRLPTGAASAHRRRPHIPDFSRGPHQRPRMNQSRTYPAYRCRGTRLVMSHDEIGVGCSFAPGRALNPRMSGGLCPPWLPFWFGNTSAKTRNPVAGWTGLRTATVIGYSCPL